MKLTFVYPNIYRINKRRDFSGICIQRKMLDDVFGFAYDMCFGDGHHRGYRTGGQYSRKKGELFCNTFQGKLAEVMVHSVLTTAGITCNEPDFGIYGEGIWDDSDIEANGKKISIKSAAFFSNLLLLETKDWDDTGRYIPNIGKGSTEIYDYFVLVRISPDIKKLFRDKRMLFSNEIPKGTIQDLIHEQSWMYDIAGYINNDVLRDIIREKCILPQNALLNGSTKMDAENYYIQSGYMNPVEELIAALI
ncbi:MAG TPA: hypothetical protein DIT04_02330 [Dysgonomonas sp.]|nr:hypothetical protein [Dysgonomonas sp.]